MILILEDNIQTAKSWRAALHGANHKVTLSYTSSEAIAHAGYEAFDVFVVDLRISINLSGVRDSGVKLLGHLNRELPEGDLPRRVIGVSGLKVEGSDAPARQAFQMFDVRYFMPKPFEPSALLETVDRVLAEL